MNRFLPLVLLLCTLPNFAQMTESPDRKASKRQVIIANVAMYASSVLGAHATSFGTQQCLNEDLKGGALQEFRMTPVGGGVFHPWRRSFALSLPADGVISLASYLLHRGHHDLMAVVLPSGSAGLQLGIAGMQYAQGCF